MSFSEKLQKLRKANELSQEGLADLLDVTRQSVSKWESGQTYPEMDKLLAMCKIFKCSLDDLTNDEITDVKIEEKKKGNLYTFIDSVLDFINKTYQTCKGMTKNEFLQCFVTMFFVGIILAFFYLPFDAISNFFCSTVQMIGDNGFVYLLSKIIEFIINTCYYLLFIIIYIYIFQIVYLNNEKYKNRVVEKKEEIIEEENSLEVNENISDHEIKVKKRERHEKVLGAGDAIFRFLGSIIMFLSKCFVCFCTIPILMILFFLCAGLLITFYLLCKGVFYISILIGIPFAIVFTILILEILFYFILGKKRNDKRIIITFLVSFIGLGLSFGMLVLDIGSIDYIDDIPKNAEVSTINRIYTMTEDLYFPFFYDIEYISDNKLENEVKVEIEYYEDYVKVYFPSDLQSGYNNYYIADNISIKNIITQMITDLKDRTFYNYGKLNEVKIKVYANDNNITILKDNYQKLYEEWEENHYQEGIDDYERRITDLEEEKSNLENEKFELESKIEELENENIEYQNKIEDYKSRLQSIIEE